MNNYQALIHIYHATINYFGNCGNQIIIQIIYLNKTKKCELESILKILKDLCTIVY